MIFGGLQKLTLLDFPGVVACTVFTKGCNFICPFCHNSPLVNKIEESADIIDTEILDFLKKRIGVLEGVAITGGEPLLHPELENFIRDVRAIGYKIKLDTNGTFPARLKHLVSEGLIDYVAMDIKNSFSKYAVTAGTDRVELDKIEESIDFLMSGAVDYEFRTTIVKELHTPDDIEKIARRIEGAERYFIQNFKDSGNIIATGMSPVDKRDVERIVEIAAAHTKSGKLR